MVDIRVHVVAQAALFADLQEEPAAHALAQDRVQHVQHVAVGVRRRQARRGQAEVRLLGLLRAQPQSWRVVGNLSRVPGAEGPRLPLAQILAYPIDHFGVGDVAGDGDHRVLGHVQLLHVADDLIAFGRADAVGRSAGVAPKWLVRPDHLVDQDVDDVSRAVLGHRQLFEDDLALLLELFRIHQRVEQAVSQDVEGGGEAVVAHLGPVHGQLFIGPGVHHAADAFDLFGDLARRRPSLGALEQHVLEEVRHTRDFIAFVARSRADEDVDADRASVG